MTIPSNSPSNLTFRFNRYFALFHDCPLLMIYHLVTVRKLLHQSSEPSGSADKHNHFRDVRALKISLFATCLVFAIQVVGGFLSNSLALLSDSGHMAVDIGSLVIALVSLRVAHRRHQRHIYSYGWRRVEILAALFNGFLLFVVCMLILREAVERYFFDGSHHVHAEQMLFVAIFGFVANGISLWFLHGSTHLTTRSAYLHVLTDLLSSGIVIVGAVVIQLTGYQELDIILSVVITLGILRSAFMLVKRAAKILMETTPETISHQEVETALLEIPGVDGIHDLHIWQLGAETNAVSAHAVVDGSRNPDDILIEINTLLLERFSLTHPTIQIESKKYASDSGCSDC